jgi:hypothetical protein
MTSPSLDTGENGSHPESTFFVLHENTPTDSNTTVSPSSAGDNLTPTTTAPHSPSANSSVSSSLGHGHSGAVQSGSTPSPSAPRERARVPKGNKMNKIREKENGQSRPHTSGHQSKPDVWSYLSDSPVTTQPPSHGSMHVRHGSNPDRAYTDPASHSQVNSYPSPGQFGNNQRPPEEWGTNNWNTPYPPSAISPSAMTFEGHFPPGPQQPPFPNGIHPPDMARGHSGTSQFSSPLFIQTNFPGPNGIPMPPFPRLPLSGYELLSAKLAGSLGGPPIKPIYRRFEALNHRLMLHLQDELSEMEDQLRVLDAADTQARQHPGGIFPASRRQESPNPNAPSAQRTELLGRIGYKICQYREPSPCYVYAKNY